MRGRRGTRGGSDCANLASPALASLPSSRPQIDATACSARFSFGSKTAGDGEWRSRSCRTRTDVRTPRSPSPSPRSLCLPAHNICSSHIIISFIFFAALRSHGALRTLKRPLMARFSFPSSFRSPLPAIIPEISNIYPQSFNGNQWRASSLNRTRAISSRGRCGWRRPAAPNSASFCFYHATKLSI